MTDTQTTGLPHILVVETWHRSSTLKGIPTGVQLTPQAAVKVLGPKVGNPK